MDELSRMLKKSFITRIRNTVQADETRLSNNVQVTSQLVLSEIIRKQIKWILYDAWADRMGERADDREALFTSGGCVLCAVANDCFANLLSAHVDFRLTHFRTRNGEHQR